VRLRLKKRTLVLLAIAAGALFASANGCYYMHVGFGEMRVLLGREKIEDAIADNPTLTADEKAKLALVPEIRRFARETIGLADSGSYRTFYDTGSKPISWNVSACAKTSFTPYLWSFPFVGAAPYKGYFDVDDAREEGRRLEALDLDTEVREVTAYSTLGWFEDPVFRRMLSYDVAELANTIVHELTHATVFRSGDADFNESCATFVGGEGALAFLAAKYGPDSAELAAARASAHDEALFTEFMGDLYQRLDRLYTSAAPDAEKLARRKEIFEAAKRDFEALRKARFETGGYAWFARVKLNNCIILAHRAYHLDLAAFEDVHRLTGGDWKRTIAVFRAAAAERAPRGYLADWRIAERERRAGQAAALPVSAAAK
jgi:predicted aminopeptidase